jgi:dihydrofolate reductase
MGKLIYSGFTSLDGYVADAAGNFEWAPLGEDALAFINVRESRIGTYLFGRRVYETMAVWETPDVIPGSTAAMMDYVAVWQAADKIVYSRTLSEAAAARTRIERSFDPDAVRAIKTAATRDLGVGGAALAAQAIRAGLVDEYHQLIAPVIAGGGTRYLPDDVRVPLELVDQRRFEHGLIYLQYRATNRAPE